MGDELQARLTPSPAETADAGGTAQAKRKSRKIEELADADVDEFRCPACGRTYPDERIVRVHITRSTDDTHQTMNGFMPEVEVEALDEEGNQMGTIPGAGSAYLDGAKQMAADELPDDFSEEEKQIIATAIQNPHVEEYSELHKMANERLQSRGLDTVQYSKAYRTIKEYLDAGHRREGAAKDPENATFKDLTDPQKAILLEDARTPSASNREIARRVGVNESYPGQILDKYSHLAEQLHEMDELPPVNIELDDYTYPPEETATMSQAQSATDIDEEEIADYDELTSTQQEIVDTYAKNPGITNREVKEEVGCAISYPTRVKSKYGDLIEYRRREVFGIDEDEAARADMRNRPAQSYEELTEKQQRVMDELLREPDPTDPDRTHQEIADAAGEQLDDDSVHSTYVGDLIRKYGGLLEDLDEADEEDMPADAPVTGTNARAMSASPYDYDEEDTEVEEGEATDIDLDNLEDLDYQEVQQVAMDRDIRGDQSKDELIEAIREHEGYYADEETEAESEVPEEPRPEDLDLENADQYEYRTLQKAAVNAGIQGNLSRSDLVDSLRDHVTEDEAEPEPETTEDTTEESVAPEVPEDPTPEDLDVDRLEEYEYNTLQKVAAKTDIQGNQKKDDLVADLRDYLTAEPEADAVEAEEPEAAPAAERETAPVEEPEAPAVEPEPASGGQRTQPLLVGETEGDELVAIPRQELENLVQSARSHRKTAEDEADRLDNSPAAVGRMVVASAWEDSIEQLIERYAESEDVEEVEDIHAVRRGAAGEEARS